MALPTVEKVITQYLYKSDTVPGDFTDENLIRNIDDFTGIDINISEYMSTEAD